MNDRRLRILLVDDDEDDYVITRDLLSEIKEDKFDLEWANTYDDALKKMRSRQHDVYLIDYHLGQHNGLELLKKNTKQGGKVPIILLTGQGDRKMDIQAMKAGAADYLDKSEIGAPLLERSIRYTIERHRLQTQLQSGEARLKTIITNNVDGIIIIDGKGKIQFTNPAAKTLFNCNAKQLLEQLFQFPFTPGEIRELNLVCKNGTPLVIAMGVAKIEWEGEGAYLASLRNITKRKQAEEQVRLLTHQFMKAQEQERQKLSRDLHDSVAQDLSALKIGMDLLFDSWPKAPANIKQKVSEYSNTLWKVVTAIRDLSYVLSPAGLKDLGLEKSILRHCEEFSEKTAVKVNLITAGIGNIKFDPDIEINLYRLIQEALNNVRKHAKAKNVTLKLVASFPKIILRIDDDGIGFDFKKRMVSSLNEKRMGLRSMNERVYLLKGTMKVQSQSRQGTKILIEIPLHEERGKGPGSNKIHKIERRQPQPHPLTS